MTIHDLAENLLSLANKIENETIDLREIVDMADMSRELHERLVVIRYKALSENIKPEESNAEPIEKLNTPDENIIESDRNNTSDAVEVSEPFEEISEFGDKEFRLDLNVSNPVGQNQISLIDSIEEMKKMEKLEKSLNDKFSDPQETPTIAGKHKKTSVSNLKSALSINQRFVFISELFNGEADTFEQSINKLNNFSSFIEADEFIQNNLRKQFDWEIKDPNVISFMNLVERRYI